MAEADLTSADLAAIGLTNQRETTLVWERRTGRPIAPAIVWQDRRTAEICRQLKARGLEPFFRRKTGLLLDPYFSGSKLAWLLDHVPGARRRAGRGELAFGTVDTWLLWQLTGGRVHATDASNASRTLLLDLRTGDWDDELLRALRIPREVLPEVRASSEVYGEVSAVPALRGVPIAGVAGDQQSALFGQACFHPGMAKNTYGTVFTGGAVVQWLRDGLGLIARSADIEALAARVPDNGGVYLVPAFTGLGAPHWDAAARGAIVGLTRGSNAAHLARAGHGGGQVRLRRVPLVDVGNPSRERVPDAVVRAVAREPEALHPDA